jgi:predicted metalloprotease
MRSPPVVIALVALRTVAPGLLVGQVQVGETELAAARVEAGQASTLLRHIWRAAMPDSSGSVVAYSDSQPTGCGMLGPDNAFYCEHDDTIYYDQWFAAAIRAMVADGLDSDGDHAVFAILAHEWGHRIHQRYRGATPGIPLFGELTADCLAGAAMRSLDEAGFLAADDPGEAELALRLLGDEPNARSAHPRTSRSSWSPRPAPGDPAAPGRYQRGLTRHGGGNERVASFQRGLRKGAGSCLKELGRR